MAESLKDLPIEVQGVASINRRGNVIDDGWYRHVTHKESGKAHLVAIMILADICYWYTPSKVEDEASGKITGYKKKFASDKLQKTYKSLAEKFGVSKNMAQTACYRLKELGLITIEVRDIDDRQGLTFLEPVSANIKKISCMSEEFELTPLNSRIDPPSILELPPLHARMEHTYTTPETTIHISEEEEDKKNGVANNNEEGPGHQAQEGYEGNDKVSQYSYLANREGATHEDLAKALKYLEQKPGVENPIAVLTEAIKRAKLNRELTKDLASKPKAEKKLASKRTAPKSTIPSSKIRTAPEKYENFYL